MGQMLGLSEIYENFTGSQPVRRFDALLFLQGEARQSRPIH